MLTFLPLDHTIFQNEIFIEMGSREMHRKEQWSRNDICFLKAVFLKRMSFVLPNSPHVNSFIVFQFD